MSETRDARDSGTAGEPAAEPAVPVRWTVATVYDDMWVDPADDPRETGVDPGDERAVLLDLVGYYRLTLRLKCAGLDPGQLARRSVPPSTMSLLGLVRHATEDERHLRRVMTGEAAPPLYRTPEGLDGAWDGAVADPAVVEAALAAWEAEIEATDAAVAGIGDLGAWNAGASDLGPDGANLTLRTMLVAHVAEYARHCGHADLLRERVDGRVGQ